MSKVNLERRCAFALQRECAKELLCNLIALNRDNLLAGIVYVLYEVCRKRVPAFCAQIVLVKPLGLVGIKACSRFDYPLQREGLYKLLQREDLLLCARVPAKEREHIYKCLRVVAILPISS